MEQDNAVQVSGPTPTPIAICNYSITTSGGGVIVPGTFQVERSQCTDCTVHIDIPFVYTLYNQQFTVIHAGNAGNVQFPTFTNLNNGCLPQSAFYYTIVPYFEDMDTTAVGDGIFTSVSGTQPNRILNIEWRAHSVASGQVVHFEVRIYEGQERFDMIYDQVDCGGSNASTGVQLDNTNYQIYQCQSGGITPGHGAVIQLRMWSTNPDPYRHVDRFPHSHQLGNYHPDQHRHASQRPLHRALPPTPPQQQPLQRSRYCSQWRSARTRRTGARR